MKNIRIIVVIILIAISKQFTLAQNVDLSQFCDNSVLLAGAKNDSDKKERDETYKKLLGVLSELSNYRQQYLSNGDPVNLFPSVYFQMTAIELEKIRQGNFTYPTEKMRQMLYFYDAYKSNRSQYDINKSCGEEHWSKHFREVDNFGLNILCQSLRTTINSAIRAHVRFDLARAIRYAFEQRTDKSITPAQLKDEFLTTNNIFAQAQEAAIVDIKKHHGACILADPEWKIWLGASIRIDEIKQWREEAFDNAIVSPIPLLGYGGLPLIPQPSYFPHKSYLDKGEKLCKKNSTLFLFDLSGSMNENGANSTISKLQQAKNASKQTLNGLKSNNSSPTPEVAVLGFSGDCAPDPTTMISNFETNLSLVESRIDAMGAGGGTPLAEAIAASECKLANYLSQTGQNNGKLIVLSDGQATCQPIRPSGTYNSGQFGQTVIPVSARQCVSSNYKIKYYTIGLNIAAGSPAERDLQYLSQISGGKYLNVQSQTQLERAFRKFNRTYIPKPSPYSNGLPTTSVTKFDEGVSQINAESFSSALKNCEEFAKLHPDDCHGAYNLALMQEANDFYKNAITNYQKYLSLCPSAPDKEFVEKQIAFLEEEFRQFLLFQKEVVKSDLEYLKIHFDKIQNGQSVALAEEFKGFLKEKGDYYKNLSELTGKNSDRIFKKNCQEVALGLDTCAKTINRNPSTWDRDATPSLSMTYLNLERLLEGF